MFSLPDFTKVKVLDVTVLSQKNRPGANPRALERCRPTCQLRAVGVHPALRNTLSRRAPQPRRPRTSADAARVEPSATCRISRPIARHTRSGWSDQAERYDARSTTASGGKSNLKMGDARPRATSASQRRKAAP